MKFKMTALEPTKALKLAPPPSQTSPIALPEPPKQNVEDLFQSRGDLMEFKKQIYQVCQQYLWQQAQARASALETLKGIQAVAPSIVKQIFLQLICDSQKSLYASISQGNTELSPQKSILMLKLLGSHHQKFKTLAKEGCIMSEREASKEYCAEVITDKRRDLLQNAIEHIFQLAREIIANSTTKNLKTLFASVCEGFSVVYSRHEHPLSKEISFKLNELYNSQADDKKKCELIDSLSSLAGDEEVLSALVKNLRLSYLWTMPSEKQRGMIERVLPQDRLLDISAVTSKDLKEQAEDFGKRIVSQFAAFTGASNTPFFFNDKAEALPPRPGEPMRTTSIPRTALKQKYLDLFQSALVSRLQDELSANKTGSKQPTPPAIHLMRVQQALIDGLSLSITTLSEQELLRRVVIACRAVLKQVSESVSKEVARAVFFIVSKSPLSRVATCPSADMVTKLFSFNTDSKELEKHLRLQAIAYLLKQGKENRNDIKEQGVAQVKEIAAMVADTFGKKESFKLMSIAKEVLTEQLEFDPAKSSAVTIPASQWPGALTNLPTPHPSLMGSLASFEAEYSRKFQKRKLQVLHPGLGIAVLVLKKSGMCFRMNTVQAEILLAFNSTKQVLASELRTKTKLPEQALASVVAPLLAGGIISEVTSGVFEVRTGGFRSTDFSLPSSDLISVYAQVTGVNDSTSAGEANKEKSVEPQVEEEKKEDLSLPPEQQPATTPTSAEAIGEEYNHKSHKGRVQSYIMIQLKKRGSVAIKEMLARVIDTFCGSKALRSRKALIVKINEEIVLKNIKELQRRSLLAVDEDLSEYRYMEEDESD